MSNGPAQQGAVASLAATWANSDPAAAAQWVTNFPKQPAGLCGIAAKWANSDPVQASGVADATAYGQFARRGGHDVQQQSLSTDPDGANQWAESISDPATRQNQVTTILQKWMQSDPTKRLDRRAEFVAARQRQKPAFCNRSSKAWIGPKTRLRRKSQS